MVGGNFCALQVSRGSQYRFTSFIWYVFNLFLLTSVMLFVLSPSHASAADAVTPSALNIISGHEQLEVHAPYTDDGNSNCTLSISWALSGTDWLDPSVETIVVDHQDIAFSHLIKNLQNFTTYQVKVEFLDDDGITNALDVQIVPSIMPYNRLIHSSLTTGSLKWSVDGGWGLPSSRYGEFGCKTCHDRATGNIKRIKKSIEVTDPLCLDKFPIQEDGASVTFLNARGGASDFGDDQRIPPESSTNICESCHTQNKFHNYNWAVMMNITTQRSLVRS
ncbi:MAG: hypothetical protein JRC99_12145 [Deltaproteobacteria bacterium]|nr:hypothetical protein [Deltaproteobacteria bacterium]